jgi:hypothetical protein
MTWSSMPPFAAWRFVGAVDGFEVLYADTRRLRGHTSAVEDGRPYAVDYDIELDEHWRTREVRVSHDVIGGPRSRVLLADGHGTWTVDGQPAPHLDGLVDVDLEASACTNTLPVHRLPMPSGEVVTASAAYVQAFDLEVRRLDQTYRRRDEHSFDYTSEGGFTAVLTYDATGLVLDYPGIATRFA